MTPERAGRRARGPGGWGRPAKGHVGRVCLLQCVLLLFAVSAGGDEIRPALLDLKEQKSGFVTVTWKVPTRNGRVLTIAPNLPAGLELVGAPTVRDVPGSRIEHGSRAYRQV